MAMTSTSTWVSLFENFTTNTQVMENITNGPTPRPPLDLSNWVEALTLLTTNASIVLSMCMLLIFKCIVKMTDNLVIDLVQCLAVVDLFYCVGMDMGIAYYAKSRTPEKSGRLCVVQSFICTLSDLVSFFYTFYIILYVFCKRYFHSEWMKGRKAKCLYHSVAWVIPLAITIAAISVGALGDATSRFGSWCWIKESSLSDKERFLWMLFTKQIWELLIYMSSMLLIIITKWLDIRTRRKTSNSSVECAETSENSPRSIMIWVLLYFYLTRIWGTTRNMVRIVGLACGSSVPGFAPFEEKFFIHAQSLGDSMQGTVNFFLFCYCNDKVWPEVRKAWQQMCCKSCKKKGYIELQ